MKKCFFMAAVAALALSSCSSDELVQEQPVAEDGAVVFDAYAGRANRAAVAENPITEVAALANAGGFGVYAYEQGKADYATYSAGNSYPNFMYNQNVWAADDATATAAKVDYETGNTPAYWLYAPVKYYSNNEGAKHSFFAYAPYSAGVKAVFSLGSAPSIRFSAGETTDLMWAAPTMNMTKADVAYKIPFDFKHALSKIKIEVAPFCDKVHGTTHTPADEKIKDGTTVTLRSVKFVGNVPSQALLSLADGSWKTEATEESAYELTNVVEMSSSTTDYQEVSRDMMVIPTEDIKIQVVYDVVTVDNENPKNNSIVTNTITSEESFDLEAGTAYDFKLDLGLTSVKFVATTVAWTTDEEINVDLPNNFGLAEISYTAQAEAPTNPTKGQMWLDSDDSIIYQYDGSTWIIVPVTPLYSLTVKDGKVQTAADTWVEPTVGAYYVYLGKLYQWK